jgi:hypothetical protein
MSGRQGRSPEAVVKEIRRQTRRKFSSEEKIRVVLEGLKGEASIVELCRWEGIVVRFQSPSELFEIYPLTGHTSQKEIWLLACQASS